MVIEKQKQIDNYSLLMADGDSFESSSIAYLGEVAEPPPKRARYNVDTEARWYQEPTAQRQSTEKAESGEEIPIDHVEFTMPWTSQFTYNEETMIYDPSWLVLDDWLAVEGLLDLGITVPAPATATVPTNRTELHVSNISNQIPTGLAIDEPNDVIVSDDRICDQIFSYISSPPAAPAHTSIAIDRDGDIQMATDSVKSNEREENLCDICFGVIHGETLKPVPTGGLIAEQNQFLLRLQFSGPSALIYSRQNKYLGLLETNASRGLATLKTTCTVCFDVCAFKNGKEATFSKIEVVIYGLREELETAGKVLSDNSTYLQHPRPGCFKFEYRNPHYFLAPGDELEIPDEKDDVSNLLSETDITDQLSDIFLEACGPSQYPEVQVSARLNTQLKSHQKLALAMMIEKESGILGDTHFDSIWKTSNNEERVIYINTVTGSSQYNRPEICLGGLLADDMGLGKSLTTLALIASTLPPSTSSGGHTQSISSNDCGFAGPTLVVTPKATLSNWQNQIRRHFAEDTFKIHIYHGASRERDTTKLAAYDIVFTTYGTLAAEHHGAKTAKPSNSSLQRVQWFRIVLDEAHYIKNKTTRQFKAACALNSPRRWCLTGTPIQNRIEEFAALLSFIGCEPFNRPAIFNKMILHPLKKGELVGVGRLRSLVKAVALRRTKRSVEREIGLGEPTHRVVQIQLVPEERRLYDWFREHCNIILQNDNNQLTPGKEYSIIAQTILRLRQICCHRADLLPPGMKAKLEAEASRGEYTFNQSLEHCEACNGELQPKQSSDEEIEVSCPHILCKSCRYAGTTGKKRSSTCPICFYADKDILDTRKSQSKAQTLQKPPNFEPSSKTKALLENILNSEPGETVQAKSVVFSSWTGMLDLVGFALEDKGIRFERLDGRLTVNQRDQSVQSFRSDPNCIVLLASIQSAGVGIDLTAASRVHLLEPQWNPQVERQALDRVHRMGQTRPVITFRYLVESSIDEYVMALQNRKEQLVKLSFGAEGSAAMDNIRGRLEDLKAFLR